MSMLAEPRSRQKWSHDPRNLNWSNDKTKFGYQMLTKMGWNEGNGLGADLSGITSHVKVNKKGCNAGIGLKKSHEDDWISHQDDFNSLLSALNGNSDKCEMTSSVENKMKASKHRYTKFVKSKDLSNASSDDLACIFGQRGKVDPIVEEKISEDELVDNGCDENSDLEIKTIESTLSMNEYFAKKMAALKEKQSFNIVSFIPDIEQSGNSNTPDPNEVIGACLETGSKNGLVKKRKKKKIKEEKDTETPSPCSSEGIDCVIENGPVKKTKKRKIKKDIETSILSPCSGEGLETVIENGLVKKKTKKIREETETSILSPCSGEGVEIVIENGLVKKKKKKKIKEEKETSIPSPCSGEGVETVTENGLVKKTKKIKEGTATSIPSPCSGEGVETVIENGLVKKKKKKLKEGAEPPISLLCSGEGAETVIENGLVKAKKKKKIKEDTKETSLPSPYSNEDLEIGIENGLVKKKKKRKHVEDNSELLQNSEQVGIGEIKKKKKKKKKTTEEET